MDFETWEKQLLGYRVDDLTGSVSAPQLDHCLTKSPRSQQVEQVPEQEGTSWAFSPKAFTWDPKVDLHGTIK